MKTARMRMTDEEQAAYNRAFDVLAETQQTFHGLPTASVLTAALDFWVLLLFQVRGNTPTQEHLMQLTDRMTRVAADFFRETETN